MRLIDAFGDWLYAKTCFWSLMGYYLPREHSYEALEDTINGSILAYFCNWGRELQDKDPTGAGWCRVWYSIHYFL